MKYCRSLDFIEEPIYDFIITLFQKCMIKNNIDPQQPSYCWNKGNNYFEQSSNIISDNNALRTLKQKTPRKREMSPFIYQKKLTDQLKHEELLLIKQSANLKINKSGLDSWRRCEK